MIIFFSSWDPNRVPKTPQKSGLTLQRGVWKDVGFSSATKFVAIE